MKIRLFADQTIRVNISDIVAGLAAAIPSVSWAAGKEPLFLPDQPIEYPETYRRIPQSVRQEIASDDLAFLFTEEGYANNYFWDSGRDMATIVSLSGWEYLTSLPRSNGIAYFAVALLVRSLGIGDSHRADRNTGCVNDFWQDKTGIDPGMRAAYICARCLGSKRPMKVLSEINSFLDQLSHASRANEDIIAFWQRSKKENTSAVFDVFLCHNSKDKPAVRALHQKLVAKGVTSWLDEEQLPPGRPWQPLLEKQIGTIRTATVLVGPSGLGPWQDVEMRSFISEFVNRACPVIPVVLPGCSAVPELPLFMRQFTWVDFRRRSPPPLDLLVWGITGKKPSRR